MKRLIQGGLELQFYPAQFADMAAENVSKQQTQQQWLGTPGCSGTQLRRVDGGQKGVAGDTLRRTLTEELGNCRDSSLLKSSSPSPGD